MAGPLTPTLALLLAAAGAVGFTVQETANPDCPDGRPEGDVDPDHPCADLPATARTETGSPRLAPLRPGEERTFACLTWGGCALLPIETPPDGAQRLRVTVLAEMAGGFSPRAEMAPGPHHEPMWSDGVHYDGGQRKTWTFEAPFAASAWHLEFTSMWEDAGGDVAVRVDFV